MNPCFAKTGVDWVHVVVSRQEVESLDISPALNVLRLLLYDAETVRMFQGRVGLSFRGYESAPRELYQIPEVRQHLASLDSQFPYWLYFLSTDDDALKLIALCLCRTRAIDPGVAHPDPADMQTFLIGHFTAINQLFDRYHLDESISEEISGLVANYFYPQASKAQAPLSEVRSNLICSEYNFELFCYRVLAREPKARQEILYAASGEISFARRLHRKNTKDNDFRRGSRGAKYCDDLQRLVRVVLNGTVPRDTPLEFIVIVRPLVQHLLQSGDIGELRKHFA